VSIPRAARVQRIRPSATVGITSKAMQLAAEGRDIIRLSVGEPDFDTPAHIKQAAIDAITTGQTKYTALEGALELKEAIRQKLARENGLDYGIEQILVSNGAKQSCFNLCLSVLDEGDEAIVPAPYWVSYPEMIRLSDAEPAFVHCAEENGFLMTPEQLAAAITPATRLLILNSPNNPTGAVYPPDVLRGLAEVLREHPRIVILSDEIYEHIQWSEPPAESFGAVVPDLLERTVTVNGMSKGYAMSGWRIGYAAGPRELIRAMSAIQSQSTTNACSISQVAATAALVSDQTSVREMCAEFESRYRIVQPLVAALPGFECPEAGGAFYLFPRVESAMSRKGIQDDVSFCEALLEATGVALVPGTAFGAPGYVRISFAAAPYILRDACER
ncbi:MAG: pyridoxal phosphate-dependent aminotransferase, partial [Gammaproteobacteria bacterium]